VPDPVAEPRHPFKALPREPLRRRVLPLLTDISAYQRGWVRSDVLAGVAIAALAVPQAMAYAQTAGLPVAAGLYGLLLPVVAYSLLGSSRLLMTGPTATAALLIAPAVTPFAADDPAKYALLAAMLAIIVGIVLVLASLAKLGWIADYFSVAVLLGFLTGLALTLISGQLGTVFGVTVPSGTPAQQYVDFAKVASDGVDGLTLAIGAITLVALLIGGRWLPKFPMLLLITIGWIAFSKATDLAAHGVRLVGEIPPGLPRLDWPSVSLGDAVGLVPAAVGVALVTFSDAILTARSVTRSSGPRVDADQELLALGGLNLAAGISQSFPVGSSGSRTAVNARLGGRTQVVGLVQVATVALVLLFLTGYLAYLPKAALGAIIIYAAIGLIDVTGWRDLARSSRGEVLIAAVTVIAMLTVGLLPALILAVLLSIIDVVRRSAQPRDAVLGWSPKAGRFVDVENHPSARTIPGIVVYRLDDRLFFANSQYFRSRIREAIEGSPSDVTAFVFDAEAVTHIDSSGARELRGIIEELADNGIRFVVARLKEPIAAQLRKLDLDETLDDSRRYPTVRAAVVAITGAELPGA
jgi:sulfate permease, SulP family